MGCGCAGGNGARRAITKYEIEGDPEGKKYLTEREARAGREARKLTGDVKPVVE